MSTPSAKTATLMVLSHEGLKRAVENVASGDVSMREFMAWMLKTETGEEPGEIVNMQPVRFMQLFDKLHRVQEKSGVEELDTKFVQFEDQPEHAKRCVNLSCGQTLTLETARRVALVSTLPSSGAVMRTVLIAFVCDAGECEAQHTSTLCHFLTIQNDQMTKLKIACDACKKVKFNAEYGVCSRCKKAQYCDRECQRADWQAHRGVCHSV